MNRINPKTLLHSKWTKVNVKNKEKHFMVTMVEFDEEQNVINCVIEAIINKNEYTINWRDLKAKENWIMGWK